MSRGMWLLVLGLLAGCNCSPQPGQQCTEPACENQHTALRCDTGIYQVVDCPGPQGCFTSRESSCTFEFICDLTGTVAGDPCTQGMNGFVLCESSTNALVCNSVNFAETACNNPCVTSQPDGTCGVCP
jgi:hypothetical protein